MIMVSKDMTIAEILDTDDNLANILMESGMHCVGCPAHSHETLEEACMGHGIDVDMMINNMNDYLNNNESK